LKAIAILSVFATPTVACAVTTDELEARVRQLAEQLETVKAELAELKSQRAASAPTLTPASTPTSAMAAAPESSPQPTFFGYGELSYSRPRENTSATTADVGRFVIGLGFRFDEYTRLVSELEVGHAVSSSSDPGEVEIEQAYIERDLSHGIFAKAGLFLIPSGMLNESHEPTRYYGVFRNFVETAIIPTTWREGGVAIQGNTTNGIRWDFGVTTGFDLSKWDATSSEGQESPLGSIHQELALAHAKELSAFGAVNYTGVPGLRLGASVFGGGAGQGQPGFDGARVLLWEGHVNWTPGDFDLSALYAHGHISGTQAINTTLAGNPTLIPEDFFGWYLQGAYRVWQRDSLSLAPFIRYERFNTASSYADLAPGLTPAPLEDREVWTAGVNFLIARGVVLKADFLDFRDTSNADRFDLGIGFQF
jgi:hypothetical protein